jgi:hypothetical protein
MSQMNYSCDKILKSAMAYAIKRICFVLFWLVKPFRVFLFLRKVIEYFFPNVGQMFGI